MDEFSWHSILKVRLKFLGVVAAASLIDALFLSIWITIQYGAALLVGIAELKGIGAGALLTLRYAFAIGTLAPVLLFIALDVITIIKQTRTELARGLKFPTVK